jgi:hypothetical protein
VCSKCHPNSPPAYTCYACHDANKIAKKHAEKKITNFSNCMQCHPTGKD